MTNLLTDYIIYLPVSNFHHTLQAHRNFKSYFKLFAHSTVCVGHREFHDQYFDTTNFDLTLQDFWLRKRKGCWELKCPLTLSKADQAKEGQSKAEALCTRYREITDLSEIQQRVGEALTDRGSLQPAKKAMKE